MRLKKKEKQYLQASNCFNEGYWVNREKESNSLPSFKKGNTSMPNGLYEEIQAKTDVANSRL